MNKGLVVGTVLDSDGKAVGDAEVCIGRVTTGGGLLYIGGQEKKMFSTDSKGKYGIPFPWSGADIGDVMNSLSLMMVAFKERREGNTTFVRVGRNSVKGYLFKDINALLGVPLSDPAQAVKDRDALALMDFAKDMIESYRKFSDYPIYKTAMATNESWMILAGANIYINN